jgi:endonuclease YncB( thermonuclease family)
MADCQEQAKLQTTNEEIMKYYRVKLSNLPQQLLFIVLLLTFSTPALSETIIGKVISVADGDTITILTERHEKVKIRLSAVDTPESGQSFGKQAKHFTSSMVFGKEVTVKKETTDRYGRTVGMVFVDGANLSEEIIRNGMAGYSENIVNGASVMIG